MITAFALEIVIGIILLIGFFYFWQFVCFSRSSEESSEQFMIQTDYEIPIARAIDPAIESADISTVLAVAI